MIGPKAQEEPAAGLHDGGVMMETNFAIFAFNQKDRLASHPRVMGSPTTNRGVRAGGY